jgi:DNA-binding NarL/FixJ family response regulator
MPGKDGRATYLELKKLKPDVRVLLTTGYALNDEAQHIIDLGVRGFIPKPFTMESLSEALAQLACA